MIGFALAHPWAIDPAMLTVVAQVLARHAAGQIADDSTLLAALATRRANGPSAQAATTGGVAVIPVHGVIAPRLNLVSEMSGGTSFEGLSASLQAALKDPDVGTIVLDINSPGGSVAGATEFAAEVLAGRAVKPILAVANHQMASAAYWLASSASKIYASKSALVGSVGVYMAHTEMSKALATLGVTKTYIAAGEHKVDITDTTPLSEAGIAQIQATVDAAYEHFIGDIAKGRSVTAASVRTGYGKGQVLTAAAALEAGMIDGIATLDATIARASGTPGRRAAQTDTLQEPSPATSQDRAARRDDDRVAIELALLEL